MLRGPTDLLNLKKVLGPTWERFYMIRMKNWSTQIPFFAYAHNTQPLSHLHNSPFEMVFHTVPRITLKFHLTISGKSFIECAEQYWLDLILILITNQFV